jgi:methyl-galactoside transport system substrate-binding protein
MAVAAGLLLRTEQKDESNGTIKIGVAIYYGDDTFISNVTNSLSDIVAKYEQETGVRLYLGTADAQGKQETQNNQIERFLALDYDVLAVNLVDRTNAAYIIDKAMAKNVPVIFFNREPVQADLQKWDRLCYIGTDAVENGRLEGSIVVDAYHADRAALDKNGDGILQYIMIEGEIRHQDAVIRTEESIQAIRDAGIAVEKLDGGIADWERSQAAALAEQYFREYGDQIEVIICNNDDMALGVIDTIDRLGLDFRSVVGIDGTPQGLKAVQEGRMLGTVVIDYQAHAELIFQAAYALATGQRAEDVMQVGQDRSIRAPMYVVKSE